MTRQLTGLPRERREPERARSRLPRHLQRLERELAHDLAALVQAGLIRPVGRVAGASDATLRFSPRDIGEVTAADVATHPPADEDIGSCGMEKDR